MGRHDDMAEAASLTGQWSTGALLERAREFRRHPTAAEAALWSALRWRQVQASCGEELLAGSVGTVRAGRVSLRKLPLGRRK